MQFKWEKIGIKTVVDKNKLFIFDPFRKRRIMATPEEEVRQFLLYQLCKDFDYPSNAIAVERQIIYNQKKKRFDALVYKDGEPIMLIECKAPVINLNQEVFHQICAYNFVLKVPYLLVSNGQKTMVARVNPYQKEYTFLVDIPKFHHLTN